MGTSSSRFGDEAQRTQAKFRTTLPAPARTPSDPIGRSNPHLLALGHEIENLYPHGGHRVAALEFFRKRDIQWWSSLGTGDQRAKNVAPGPTRNLASSQVSCVNFLLPLVRTPEALIELLRLADPSVQSLEPIVDAAGNTSLVEFEWIGRDRSLEGGTTRGANNTSADALVVANTVTGRRAFVFEWKYSERYQYYKDLGEPPGGATRRGRYAPLFKHPASSFDPTVPLDDLMYDPFYQLMRLRLLADRAVREGVSPTLRVDSAAVIVVCPGANSDYRNVLADTPMAKRFPQHATVGGAMRAAMRSPDAFAMLAQEGVVAALRRAPFAPQLADWLAYHARRYGW